jgi:hypothetical protein
MKPTNRYKPDGRESALLLLRLIEEREQRRKEKMTRVRLAELTLKDLWNRQHLPEQFLRDVQEWLLTAGWALIAAGSTFAAVRTSAVENWPRVSSKRLSSMLLEMKAGKFNFEDLAHLIVIDERGSQPQPRDDTDE